MKTGPVSSQDFSHLTGDIWLLSHRNTHRHSKRACILHSVQSLFIQYDSSYPKSCENITCSPCLFLPPSQGMYLLSWVLQLWQRSAYEHLQTPLNSYLKCFIPYLDVGQFRSLTLPPTALSLCAIKYVDMVLYFIELKVCWWCWISRYILCL